MEHKLAHARTLLDNELGARKKAEAERDRLSSQLHLLRQLVLDDHLVDEVKLSRIRTIGAADFMSDEDVYSPCVTPKGILKKVNMTEESIRDVDDLSFDDTRDLCDTRSRLERRSDARKRSRSQGRKNIGENILENIASPRNENYQLDVGPDLKENKGTRRRRGSLVKVIEVLDAGQEIKEHKRKPRKRRRSFADNYVDKQEVTNKLKEQNSENSNSKNKEQQKDKSELKKPTGKKRSLEATSPPANEKKKPRVEKRKTFVDVKLARIPDQNPYAKKAQSFRRKRENVEEVTIDLNEEIEENMRKSLQEPYCNVCEVLLERSNPVGKVPVDSLRRIPEQSVVWVPQRIKPTVNVSENICQTFLVSRLLVCSSCKVCVHEACYQTHCDDLWLCDRCIHIANPDVKTVSCYLCSGTKGALKKAPNDQFYHIRCAILIPELSREPEVDLSLVSTRRWNVSCLICDQVGKAPAVHCMASKECMLSFHLSCAYSNGVDCVLGPENNVILRCAFCVEQFQLKKEEQSETKFPPQVGELVLQCFSCLHILSSLFNLI